VWLVGEQFKASGRKAGYCCFDGLDDVLETLKKQPLKEYLILVKGSNGTRLHQLPAYL
jgi:UDP-N-acetylmuramyl pentapeptide synthase